MTENIRDNKYNLLSTRVGFNLALGHFKTALALSAEIEEGCNIADVLTRAVQEGTVLPGQLRPLLNILLVDKFHYRYCSENLRDTIESVDILSNGVCQWTMLDLVVVFYNSNGKITVINPKHHKQWLALLPLKRDELMVCFVKSKNENDLKTELAALGDFYKLLYGNKAKARKEYLNLHDKPAAPVGKKSGEQNNAKQPEAGAVGVHSGNVTARIAVQVTNELFHNGNVEAWKKIIASYKARFPSLDVLVWYDGERINDLNTLFKWGKVKHGNPIIFSVAGDDIRDVSKLKKYLFEGASPRFEVFLRGNVNCVLDLF